jgi:ABC-type dipeptide/oligopeptide/nickel transport system permease component
LQQLTRASCPVLGSAKDFAADKSSSAMFSISSSGIMASMKRSLQAKDIVNLEYFLHRDTELHQQELQLRDRAIGLQLENDSNLGKQNVLSALTRWIEARVSMEFGSPEQKSPGELFADSVELGHFLSIIIGIVLGITTGLAFFSYSGTTPVNVFSFLLLFVVSRRSFSPACYFSPQRPENSFQMSGCHPFTFFFSNLWVKN